MTRWASTEERFEAAHIPEPNSGCWLWLKSLKTGYGQFRVGGGRVVVAHRWAYERAKGPIPQGLVLDHKCRVTCCVNPDHLEPVTNAENVMRGVGFAPVNARKTHCAHGHEFSDANTYRINGHRLCRLCDLDRKRRKRAEG